MKTIHYFLGADLRCGHEGLKLIAMKKKVDLSKLDLETAVIFINASKNKMKAYSWNGVLSYIKFDSGSRGIDMAAMDEFPRAFDASGAMDYTKALKIRLEKKLQKSRFTSLEFI